MATVKLFCCFSRTKKNGNKNSAIPAPLTPSDRAGTSLHHDAEKQCHSAPPAPLSFLHRDCTHGNISNNDDDDDDDDDVVVDENGGSNLMPAAAAAAARNASPSARRAASAGESTDAFDSDVDSEDCGSKSNYATRRQNRSPSPKLPSKLNLAPPLQTSLAAPSSPDSRPTTPQSIHTPPVSATLGATTPLSMKTDVTLNYGPDEAEYYAHAADNQPKEGEQTAAAAPVIATAYVATDATQVAGSSSAAQIGARATPVAQSNVPAAAGAAPANAQAAAAAAANREAAGAATAAAAAPTAAPAAAAAVALATDAAAGDDAAAEAARASMASAAAMITSVARVHNPRALTPGGFMMLPSPHAGYREFLSLHGFPATEESALTMLPPCLSDVEPGQRFLLPEPCQALMGRKVLVLDLDETLVHSSFTVVQGADFVVPIQLETYTQNVYVQKRPGVDEFLARISQLYEIVVFTASLSAYADSVLDLLDPHRYIHHRLFRDSCVLFLGSYVKNLSVLGRDVRNVAIVDNSHLSYAFHIGNAVPILSWFDDPEDIELERLGNVLLEMVDAPNVPDFLFEKRRNGLLPPP